MRKLHSERNFNVSLYKNNKENLLSGGSLFIYLKTENTNLLRAKQICSVPLNAKSPNENGIQGTRQMQMDIIDAKRA